MLLIVICRIYLYIITYGSFTVYRYILFIKHDTILLIIGYRSKIILIQLEIGCIKDK